MRYMKLYRFKRMNICITFMWFPAHRGIKDNEIVDASAKQALKHEQIMDIVFSKMEAKGIIKSYLIKEWQHSWDTGNTGQHLYVVQRELGTVRTAKRSTKEENILTRLRVGHTRLNKTLHLINNHPSGICEHCQIEESVEHVILNCPKYSQERETLKREVRNRGMVELNVKNVFGLESLFQYLNQG